MDHTTHVREHVIDRYLRPASDHGVLPAHREIVALAAMVSGAPGAAVNLVRADAQQTWAGEGLPEGLHAREESLCARVVDSGTRDPVVVSDLRADDRFNDSAFVDGRIDQLSFYAGFPLQTPAGAVVGTLCVFDRDERTLDDDQRSALEALAKRVVDLFELGLRQSELESVVAELEVQADTLARTNRLLDAFTAQVSHDLRGPVTSLRLALESLVEDEATVAPDARWLLDSAAASARRLGTMVEESLEFARRGGRIQVCPVPLDALVDEVERDLAADLVGVELRRGELPVVDADAVQLATLVQNLVANAAKFTRGEPRPVVRVSAQAVAGGGFRLEVADNGPGIPPDQRALVFGSRWQGDHGLPGLGLGLATCTRIAEAHGGRLRAEAAPEGGALIAFEVLPVAAASEAPAADEVAGGSSAA